LFGLRGGLFGAIIWQTHEFFKEQRLRLFQPQERRDPFKQLLSFVFFEGNLV